VAPLKVHQDLEDSDDEMREIEKIDFNEIQNMIKKSLRDSEE
jgi:hypothetical protein